MKVNGDLQLFCYPFKMPCGLSLGSLRFHLAWTLTPCFSPYSQTNDQKKRSILFWPTVSPDQYSFLLFFFVYLSIT